jgi:Family of unknown function (DUF6229)
MTTVELVRAEELVAAWRVGDADVDNPAGPLFSGGEHAEADITMTGPGQSGRCGTACSGSSKYQCC